MQRNLLALAVISATTLSLYGCLNVFDPIDSPTSEPQILSAARAQFDAGNLAEARELYGKLGNNDSAEAELSFVDMNEAGITMTALVGAIRIESGESVGSILTKLAESIAKSESSGADKRAALTRAFTRVGGIENQQLRGFVRFLVGISIASEILGEENALVRTDLTLSKADIVTNSTCTRDAPACALDTNCNNNSGSGIPVGTSSTAASAKFVNSVDGPSPTGSNDTSVDLNTPSYILVTNAVLGAIKGLEEMAVTSGDAKSLGDQLEVSALALTAAPNALTERCFLSALVSVAGVGR